MAMLRHSCMQLAKQDCPRNLMSTKVISQPVANSARQIVPRAAIVVVAAYVAAQMVADIASIKIASIFDYAVDMGTFIYPITFTLRDLVHKMFGKRNARALVITAAAINLFMVLYLWIAASVAPDLEGDPEGVFNAAYGMVFGPLWRIVVASIVAEVVSELLDTEVYHWFVTKITRKFQWLRVLVSNLVSVPVDNAIFAVGAFAFVLEWSVVWEIFVFNLIVKGLVTLVSMPLIYVTPDVQILDE